MKTCLTPGMARIARSAARFSAALLSRFGQGSGSHPRHRLWLRQGFRLWLRQGFLLRNGNDIFACARGRASREEHQQERQQGPDG